jgi:hypothetical protein
MIDPRNPILNHLCLSRRKSWARTSKGPKMGEHKKPQGRKGPIRISGAGPRLTVIAFPDEKRARELMIAQMFVRAANRSIMLESPEQPRYPPFSDLVPNEENDLDFVITTSRDVKRMDVAEFAPLDKHGPEFKDAPRQLDQTTKSDLLLELVRRKSAHQGGSNRVLVIYVTEQGFWVDPVTMEITRRALDRERPRFERVYFISPHDSTTGTVSEIFPGKPHHVFGKLKEDELRHRADFPHPADFGLKSDK